MGRIYRPKGIFGQHPVRVLLDGVWIAIGTPIKSSDGKEWPEATQEQYNILGEQGRLDLVYGVNQSKVIKVQEEEE